MNKSNFSFYSSIALSKNYLKNYLKENCYWILQQRWTLSLFWLYLTPNKEILCLILPFTIIRLTFSKLSKFFLFLFSISIFSTAFFFFMLFSFLSNWQINGTLFCGRWNANLDVFHRKIKLGKSHGWRLALWSLDVRGFLPVLVLLSFQAHFPSFFPLFLPVYHFPRSWLAETVFNIISEFQNCTLGNRISHDGVVFLFFVRISFGKIRSSWWTCTV